MGQPCRFFLFLNGRAGGVGGGRALTSSGSAMTSSLVRSVRRSSRAQASSLAFTSISSVFVPLYCSESSDSSCRRLASIWPPPAPDRRAAAALADFFALTWAQEKEEEEEEVGEAVEE